MNKISFHCFGTKYDTSCGYEYGCDAPHSESFDCDQCTACLPSEMRYFDSPSKAADYVFHNDWFDSETGRRVGKKRLRKEIYKLWDAFHTKGSRGPDEI